jgi:TRAP-type mannitol/chloroaromatic compound transport system substrate-binding protein
VLQSAFPASLDTIFGAAQTLGEDLAAMTDGQFEVEVNQAGEITDPKGILSAVQRGSVDVGHTGSYYYTGFNAALAFDTCVPFGLTSRQQCAWLEEGGGLDYIRGLYADFNIVNFPGGNTGAQMGGWFRRPIEGLTDLKGLVMRIPGLGGSVMEELGVRTQQIAGGEIYQALELGTIDATEWVGPYDDEKLGFPQIAKHYYYPGWWEPGPQLSFLVNRDAWDDLPSAYQAAFEVAARRSAIVMQSRYDAKNPPAFRRILESDVQVTPFSADIMDAASDAATQILEDQAAADSTYRELYESWKRFRAGQFEWFGAAELAYARYAFGR